MTQLKLTQYKVFLLRFAKIAACFHLQNEMNRHVRPDIELGDDKFIL